jgi:DNA-binding CsgD family transcriptional regulator
MREQTASTVEVNSSNDFGRFSVVGNFRINDRYYLIINLGNSSNPFTKSNLTACCPTALEAETARFEFNGQLLAIIEAENCPHANPDIAALLTSRELQIATLVASGHCNKKIASRLCISEWTVSTHLRRIFAKLGVDSRAAMVYRCALLLYRP